MDKRFSNLPLRKGVGIALLNNNNQIFVAKRIDNPYNFWQMPQGGIDVGEEPLEAAFRELKEETGFTPHKMFVADHVSSFYESHFDRINLVPVFGIEVRSQNVVLSEEHCEYEWLEFEKAYSRLTLSLIHI